MMGRGISAFGGAVFRNCYNLRFVVNPLSGGSLGWTWQFPNCYSLQQVITNNDTDQTGNCDFSNNYSLIRCYIIGSYTYDFTGCYSLKEIVVNGNLSYDLTTSSCYAAVLYDFRSSTTVPTGTVTLNVSRADCKIVVPDSLYSSWVSASNWSSYSSKIISASDYANL